MRKKVVLLAVSALVLATVTPFANAAVKPGTACSKQGQTITYAAIKHTCIKSGKKLVWSKGVAVKKAAPVASPTASATKTPSPVPTPTASQKVESFTPWATNFNQKQVSDEAQRKFREWAALQPDKSNMHKLIKQAGVPSTRGKNFTLVDDLGLRLFGQFFTRQSTTVLGTNEKWVVDQLTANGGIYNSCNINSGNGGLNYCLDNGTSQGYVITTDINFQPGNPGSDGSALLAHEFFHIVQRVLGSNSTGIATKTGVKGEEGAVPIWFIEGTANFVGFSVAALALNSTYWEGRPMMFQYAPRTPDANKNTLEDYEIRNGPGNNSPTYPYIAGQLATEYLVASVGFQKMLDILIDFKTSKNFEKSFQTAIGISKAEFYEKFERARTNLGLPEVSYKLVCLTNYKLNEVPKTPPPCILDSMTGQGSPNQQSSPIKTGSADIVPNGFLKARATWSVTGHESYRLYVTDVVDFQKVYFESGFVNDSRNPLVIDITGLVCNKEFRVVTEFFTEKSGKGEKLMMESKQLRNLSCEDTTKKP
jgi:hypothetical protein